jgi:hypothetical protein
MRDDANTKLEEGLFEDFCQAAWRAYNAVECWNYVQIVFDLKDMDFSLTISNYKIESKAYGFLVKWEMWEDCGIFKVYHNKKHFLEQGMEYYKFRYEDYLKDCLDEAISALEVRANV